MADNTVFDSVFKTMLNKEPQLFVPFINEAFGRSYPLDEPVVPLSTEYETARGERFADSVFRLADRIYHVECQSTSDADMVVRMIEYDIAIALGEAIRTGRPYVMRFPESCVLYLRADGSTTEDLTMQVILPSEESFEYKVRAVNAQGYTSEEIFEKHLLLLLPYYLMRYERELTQIEADDVRSGLLVAECAKLRAELELITAESGNLVLYDNLVELIIKVSDYMLRANEVLQRKVRGAMGGEVLELWHDRYDRAQRDAEDARQEAEDARQEATEARQEATEARKEADDARREAEEVKLHAGQIAEQAAGETAAKMADSLRAAGIGEEAIQQALASVRVD